MKQFLFCSLLALSLNIFGAAPAQKTWNVCPDGQTLPKTTFKVTFGKDRVKITTPDDEDQVAKLASCHHFPAMIQQQVTDKIIIKYKFNPHTEKYGIEPQTLTFLLKTDGEIEEVFEKPAAANGTDGKTTAAKKAGESAAANV